MLDVAAYVVFALVLNVRVAEAERREEWLKPNSGKPRKRGSGISMPPLPAVNGGPKPLRGKPRKRG